MRRWLIFIFLADLAATPFLIGMFVGDGSAEHPIGGTTRPVATASLPSLDPCILLSGTSPEYQGIVDHYRDIQQATDELGIETSASDC